MGTNDWGDLAGTLARLDAALAATPRHADGFLMMEATPEALLAARLLGHDRPHRRTPTDDLIAEGEYALRRLDEATGEGAEQLQAYFLGVLDSLVEEAHRRSLRPEAFRAPRRIDAAVIERIRAAVPCHEFVQWAGAVDLRPIPKYRPIRWVGLCPFHHEKTPSFIVHPTYFHCFGCDISGDVFEYARLRAGLEPGRFVDAVRIVAAYAGIALLPTEASAGVPPLGDLYVNR